MRHRTRIWIAGLALVVTGGMLGGAVQVASASEDAGDEVTTLAGCDNHPGVPKWFYPTLRRAAAKKGDGVPARWGKRFKPRRAMMKIICNESSFNTGAINRHDDGPFYGLGQMGRPAIRDARVKFACYWYVKNDCSHNRRYVQSLAALRYANQRYTTPQAAWRHWRGEHWW
ncbi:MAG: hypothetical protein ACRDT8_03900 [Micromonosporaceae bacterium]